MSQQPAPVKKKKKIKVPKVVNGVDTLVEIEVDDEGGPEWGANDKHTLLNHRLLRVDGPLKVSGAAQYTYDRRAPGMLYGRVLRSPHAHARVIRIDATAARLIPGVKAIVGATNEDVVEGSNRATDEAEKRDKTDMGEAQTPKRKERLVRFAGEPVAAVAATTPEIAEDAIRAIRVTYEVLPHVVRAEDAIKEGAPQVYPEGNLEEKEKKGDAAKVKAALEKCDMVFEAEYRTPILHHSCLETHGNMVDYRGDEATVYASTQGTFTIPGDAAKELGLKESAVTAIVEHMGGGFGSKFGIGIEGMMACQLAKQAKAPVKLMLTRRDEFALAGNRSGSWQKLKAGVSRDGKVLALYATQYQLGGLGDGSQAGQPYIYTVEDVYRERIAIHTHEDSSRAMRAPGHPQASFAIESLMDELAYKTGIDPLEFRKRNLKDTVYHRQLDRGAREIGWERRNKTPGAEGLSPLVRGIGCAIGTWGGGGGPQCKVEVNISRDGSVTVAVGTQDLGTGTRTYTRAIVAEELGLQVADVIERIGNSKLGAANSSGGSTTSASLAPAVKDAAVNARVAMASKLSPLLANAKPEELTFARGRVSGGGQALTWKQACAALPSAGLTAHGEWKATLAGRGVHGACFAEVEVDTETGHVRPIKMVHVQDIGLPLNRLAVESQINGGMIQSLGMALWEGRVMDAPLGLQLNAGFGDYKLPGSLEMPELVPLIDDEDKRELVIGVGEPAIIPSVGALVNAVFNACGVRVRELPATPDKILMGLMEKRRAV
jgi:xanthine dehydrogenase YagR molybdenum-binding subunit